MDIESKMNASSSSSKTKKSRRNSNAPCGFLLQLPSLTFWEPWNSRENLSSRTDATGTIGRNLFVSGSVLVDQPISKKHQIGHALRGPSENLVHRYGCKG